MHQNVFTDNYFLNNAISTLGFALFFFIFKYLGIRFIRNANKPWAAEQRLRWIGYFRSFSFCLLILAILYIWGEQLHSFAVSIFAIAFALVFSVKELCMCFNGSMMRLRGNVYNLGDRIEMKDYRGDVIDFNMLTTTLLEIGPGANSHHYTGRIVTFPNSMIMEEFVINETFIDHFFMHNLVIPLTIDSDWQKARRLLLKIAQEECTPFLDQARKSMRDMTKQKGMQMPSVEPRVILQLPDPKQINLILRVPSPVHLKGRLEQTILAKFLEQFLEEESKQGSVEVSVQN